VMKMQLFRTVRTAKQIGLVALSAIFVSASALAQEIIVDDNSGGRPLSGIWYDSSGPNPYLGHSVYNNNHSRFYWPVMVPVPGDYDVYAWWTYHPNRSNNVPYEIQSGGSPSGIKVYVDQHDSTLGGQWNLLGRFSFVDVMSVTVSSENGQASADAVRFVLRGSPEPPGPSGLSGWSRQSITCPNRSPGTRAGEWYYCDRRCLPTGTRILGGGGDYAQVHGVQPTGPVEWEMISSAPIADDLWRTVWRANTATTVNFAATTYALCATEAAPP
jgi:hypothetical protein